MPHPLQAMAGVPTVCLMPPAFSPQYQHRLLLLNMDGFANLWCVAMSEPTPRARGEDKERGKVAQESGILLAKRCEWSPIDHQDEAKTSIEWNRLARNSHEWRAGMQVQHERRLVPTLAAETMVCSSLARTPSPPPSHKCTPMPSIAPIMASSRLIFMRSSREPLLFSRILALRALASPMAAE